MRQLSPRAVALSLSLLLVVVAQSFGQRRAPGKETVVFEATGYGDKKIILPIVIVRGGRFIAPPAFNMKAARRQFAASYYRPGQKYRLLNSDGEGGTVTVKSHDTCDPTAAYVEAQPAGAAEGRTLATNSDSFAGRPIKRRELTEAEQTEMMKLIDPPFRKGGYGEPSLTGVSSIAEAIVSVNDYRSQDDWYYVIYKKQGGRWRSVCRGGGFRCPEDRGEH